MKVNTPCKIIKASARAFTNPFHVTSSSPSSFTALNTGGNPVTVFHFNNHNTQQANQLILPTSKVRTELAKSCQWESVITYSGYPYDYFNGSIMSSRSNRSNELLSNENEYSEIEWNRIWFYMPSGEEVSFCAHAAMAACSVMKNTQAINNNGDNDANKIHFLSGILSDEEETDDEIRQCRLIRNQALIKAVDGIDGSKLDEIYLEMPNTLDEGQVDQDIVRKLLNEIGLTEDDVMSLSNTKLQGYEGSKSTTKNHNLPACINSSVARNKTLIPIRSESKLHSATNPKDAIYFRDLCDQIDSTGIYLYTPLLSSLSSYQCRQFPRFSGYPEDPATGIAAAALANSLYSRQMFDKRKRRQNNELDKIEYEILQGTAMGKPSRIKISFDHDEKSDIITCSGIIEIDDTDEIQTDGCYLT